MLLKDLFYIQLRIQFLAQLPFPHIHISVADDTCKAFGGHLNEATISATFEGVMQIIDHEIHREFNEDLGLALMNVCGIK